MIKRKTGWAVLAASALAVLLTACGAENATEGLSAQGGQAAVSSVQEAGAPTLSAEELLEQAAAAASEVTGYRLRTDREEHDMAAYDGEPTFNYIIETSLTTEPFAAYRELGLLEKGSPPNLPLKRYMSEEAVYTVNVEGYGWNKEPKEDLADTLEHLRQSTDLSRQLQNLQEAEGDSSVTVQNGNLLLTVVLEGDEHRAIAEQYMRQSDDSLPRMQGDISKWEVQRLEVSYEFDRSTFLPVASAVKFELAIPENAEMMPGTKRNFSMKANYSDYDEIEEIKVPAEVEQEASASGS